MRAAARPPIMDRTDWLLAAVVGGLVLAAGLLVVGGQSPGDVDGYNRTTVTLADANGTQLATVDVRIADTESKRRLGLSNTGSLAAGEGMLFVHESEGRHVYVMREMVFPLDIVFVAENGTITTIHHAPVPEEIPGGNGRFPGRGKYVLEVPRGWTNATGVDVGERVVVPAQVAD